MSRPTSAGHQPPMSLADVRALLESAAVNTAGPCNRRCRARGTCAFNKAAPDSAWCRRTPRRAERDAVRSRDDAPVDRA